MAKEGSAVTIDISQLEGLSSEIGTIDTQISAATGSEAAIKKATAERLASENSDQVDGIVTQVVTELRKLPVNVLVGVVDSIGDSIDDEFSAPINEFLKEEVAKVTAGSKEDVAGLRENRKAKVEEFRALKTILETFQIDTSSVPEPKRSAGRSSSGGASKTGLNKDRYRFTLDGKDRPDSQNSISSLAFYATPGCGEGSTEEKPEKWSTAQLKEYLASNGVNFGADDEFSVTLPNGKVVGAHRMTDEEVEAMKASASDDGSAEPEATPEAQPEEQPAA
jgi:hypothetical protein